MGKGIMLSPILCSRSKSAVLIHNLLGCKRPQHRQFYYSYFPLGAADQPLPIGRCMTCRNKENHNTSVFHAGYYFHRVGILSSNTQQHRWMSNDYAKPPPLTYLNNNNRDGGEQQTFEQPKVASSSSSPNTAVKDDVTTDRNRTLHDLSEQLVLLFSDFNLRNNDHGRSIFQEYDNAYLPVKEILKLKPIQKCTGGVHGATSLVMDAIDFVRENNAALISTLNKRAPPVDGEQPLELDVDELDNGEFVVRRTPPFNYIDSIRNNYKRMMVIEGFPTDRKVRGPINHVRNLISKGVNQRRQPIPISYWRFNHQTGVINIEFKSEIGAMEAWECLEQGDPSRRIQIQNQSSHHDDNMKRSYQLQLGDISLVARSIDMPKEVGILIDQNEMEKIDAVNEQSHVDPQIEHKPRTTEVPIGTTIVDQPSPPPRLYDKLYSRPKTLEINETPTLGQFTRSMNKLYDEHTRLPPPPREWLHEYDRRPKGRQQSNASDEDEMQNMMRYDLYRDVVSVVSTVKASIEQGKIRGLGGKDGYALSDSLGRAMLIYSQTPPFSGDDESSSPYEACLDVLAILRSLNLDIHPSQYFYAIRSACHESRWEEAAKMFLSQIDGDDTISTGGFVPINSTLGWDQPLEMGLYAVALDLLNKSSEDESSSTSKQVFDVAMKCSMISPSGQENYVLAAGSALGRAGLSEQCLDVAADSNSISKYGPAIVAASMLACIEQSRFTDAIGVYDVLMSEDQSAASDWQWGGGNITAAKPLCRDLTLNAMGRIRKGGYSRDAMLLFQEILREDSSISTQALLGLVRSLEHDGDWRSSIKLLMGYVDSVYRKMVPGWRIVSDALYVNKTDDVNTLTFLDENYLLADVLSSTMRVCNYEGQYGLAIVLCSLVNAAYIGELQNTDEWIDSLDSNVLKYVLSQEIVSENREILEVYMQSLHGLGCESTVNELLNAFQNDENIDATMPWGLKRNKSLPHGESSINAIVAVGRVVEAMFSIQHEGTSLSEESRLLFERGLARAMEHLLDSSQPSAALYLFDHASAILVTEKDPTTFAGRVRTFLGIEDSYVGDREASEELFQTYNAIELKDLHLSDSLLAAVIQSYIKLGQPEKARAAFFDGTMHIDDSTLMIQSTNSVLEALLDIDINECVSFLDTMDVRCLNPSTFYLIARRFAENGIWPEIGEIYNKAQRVGCISEDLGLLAMQAVSESELLSGKIIVLRRIVEDVCNAAGVGKGDWLKSRYWGIKRTVGFHHARLLMNWNDPAESQKEELLFAVNDMRRCASEGIVSKNDPLMCIVKIAQLYETGGKRGESNALSLSEKQRQSSVNLILKACQQAKQSGFLKSYHFTTEAAKSLRALKANKTCIKLVRTLLPPDGDEFKKCKHKIAMEEAIYAAIEERDDESLQLITDVYDKSGHDSSKLFKNM